MTEDRLIAALTNATFQTIALSLLVALVLRLAPRTSASARCAIWTGALFVAVALPVVDFARVEHVSAPEAMKTISPAPVRTARLAAVSETAVTFARVGEPPVAPQISPASVKMSLATVIGRIAHIALYLWVAGIAFFALRLLYQIACLLRAKSAIVPGEAPDFLRAPRLRRRVALGVSDRVAVPCLLGLFRPVIALPHVLAADLSGEDIQRIVLHEAAHLERFDDWFNLFEQIALVFLFFNPALHYIARQIGMEREIACDDHVIAKSQNRITYAECLAELARRCAGRRALTVPGFFTNRRQILVRVEQLLDRAHNGSPRIGRKAFAAVGMVTAAGLLLSQVGIPVVAAAICPLQRSTPHSNIPRAAIAYAPPAALVSVLQPAPVSAPRKTVAPRKMAAPRKAVVARRTIAPRARVRLARPASVTPVAAAPEAVSVATATSESAAPSAYAYASSASSTPTVAADVAHAVNAVASAEASVRSQDASYSDGPSLSGYSGMTADQIVDLHDHGVDGKYIESMKAAGFGGLSAQDLIRLRDHDVSAAFASAMSGLATHRLKVSELVDLRDHGVDPAYAAALVRYGLRGMAVDRLINLRDHGVSPDYLAGLAQVGFAGLSAEQTIRLRDHGVTASYIQHVRHDLNPAALTVDEIIKLRDAGI